MKVVRYLGWILLLVLGALGIVFYNTSYLSLRNRLAQQVRETEMWMSKTDEMKRRIRLDETRQQMAPDFSLPLIDLFAGPDSFSLTRFGRDTLAAVANELRRSQGKVTVTVYADDAGASLYTRARFVNSYAFAAAKGAAVIQSLLASGVKRGRIALVVSGADATEPVEGLSGLMRSRVEIRVDAGG
ncbi:MAG: hypothetical protein ABIK62_06240 [candidate division WOR-3 bacterium]